MSEGIKEALDRNRKDAEELARRVALGDHQNEVVGRVMIDRNGYNTIVGLSAFLEKHVGKVVRLTLTVENPQL